MYDRVLIVVSSLGIKLMTPINVPTVSRPVLRPPLNEKLFPVDGPNGSKRADWKCFFPHDFLFFSFSVLPCTF